MPKTKTSYYGAVLKLNNETLYISPLLSVKIGAMVQLYVGLLSDKDEKKAIMAMSSCLCLIIPLSH